jgi:hypothetical protein
VIFYLGVPEGSWRLGVPTFVSARRLRRRATPWPWHGEPYAIDSGGFTELSQHGKWMTSPQQYSDELLRWADWRGQPDWAAPQDWMCEPEMLERTGLTIEQHQHASVCSVLQLREALQGQVNVIPVLQGWDVDDYVHCVELYSAYGLDLQAEPIVGVGTVCRRQDTSIGNLIMRTLAGGGLRLHGFGYKTEGLLAVAEHLVSADSMAWSYQARLEPHPLPGCSHRCCNSCPRYALRWREQLLQRLSWREAQQTLW